MLLVWLRGKVIYGNINRFFSIYLFRFEICIYVNVRIMKGRDFNLYLNLRL